MYIDVNNINSNRKIVMSSKQDTAPFQNIDTLSKSIIAYNSLFSIKFTIKFSINITKRYKKCGVEESQKIISDGYDECGGGVVGWGRG